MRASGSKTVNRSALYHLMNTIVPIDHALKARFDAVGSVSVIGLLLGWVFMLRWVLGFLGLMQ